ncbi:Tetraacyldisaccharide 4'-kinase [Halomonadaceae bacterium LMG 33818]|uniref:tetraacyldisaccharide 4'-kinase n=1 Tax=Cernens ardua TaxID=3402176 RepID=UPI003EDC3968
MSLGDYIQQAWYTKARWLVVLRPLESLYRAVVNRRRTAYETRTDSQRSTGVPVIVVGNITVGGTGKSPLAAWLVNHLSEKGWKPGIVSRGYGGTSKHYPLSVTSSTPPSEAGDEPVMLAAQTGVPVAVDPHRPRAVALLADQGCDIVVSDDGLQHYAMERALELVVIDGARGLGNQRCLPEGPLREPVSRLQSVDAVIVNGPTQPPVFTHPNLFHAAITPVHFRSLMSDNTFPLSPIPLKPPTHAVAGIGHPQRFFQTLSELGVEFMPKTFPDHHDFSESDLHFDDNGDIVMTAKDAIKCVRMSDPCLWALDVRLQPDALFIDWLDDRLDAIKTHGALPFSESP